LDVQPIASIRRFSKTLVLLLASRLGQLHLHTLPVGRFRARRTSTFLDVDQASSPLDHGIIPWSGKEANLQSSKAGGLQPLGPANAQLTRK
jgi:hypothetical protein